MISQENLVVTVWYMKLLMVKWEYIYEVSVRVDLTRKCRLFKKLYNVRFPSTILRIQFTYSGVFHSFSVLYWLSAKDITFSESIR